MTMSLSHGGHHAPCHLVLAVLCGLLLMLGVGAAGLLYAMLDGGWVQWGKALATNQALLAMLAGVSFLRLISLPEVDAGEDDPRGRGALWRTLFGVHLFGSVINLSAVMILGDRQSRRASLTPLQASVLSRGFSLAALWSPFFAAMGVALSHAPGAQLLTLSSTGLPLALFGLLLSGWCLTRRADIDIYVGYPMHFGALWIPALLAALVLSLHLWQPQLPILTLISGSALGLTLIVLLLRDAVSAPAGFGDHVADGLPRMSGELALFLAAGVLAAGIASAVAAVGFTLDLAGFGAGEASVLLVLMVLLSVAGVHPVISIATASGLLLPLAPDADLLGIVYLMTWAAGVSSSPLSGMHLGMQGRFGIDARGFLRWNSGFTLIMLVVDIAVLHLFARFAGLIRRAGRAGLRLENASAASPRGRRRRGRANGCTGHLRRHERGRAPRLPLALRDPGARARLRGLVRLGAALRAGALPEAQAADLPAGGDGAGSPEPDGLGGVSAGGLSRSSDNAASFAGRVSLENNGGFASVLGALDHPLRPFSGVRLTVAGDGRRYQVRLRSDDDARGIAWRAEFEAGPEPRRITLTPRDFEPVFRGRPVADAPALSEVTIRHFGFMLAGGEAGRFRLQVESAEFGAATDENSNGRRLVIGASRGIGLALTAAQLADAGVKRVIATHRAGSDMRGLDDLRHPVDEVVDHPRGTVLGAAVTGKIERHQMATRWASFASLPYTPTRIGSPAEVEPSNVRAPQR